MLHCFRVSHRIRILILLFAVQLSAEAWSPGQLRGESPLLLLAQVTPGTQTPSGTNVSQAELDSLASDARRAASGPKPSNPPPKTEGMNFLTLLVRGGWFMVPIGVVSLIVVAVGLERSIMLRNSRMIPQGLIRSMGALARESEVLDPKAAYRLCQQFPSSAANVIRTMLLKVGRPHSEVETAIRESTQREADRAYAGVRWLSLSAGIAPLLGLLGTVWGLMRSFHDLGQIGPSQNRGQYLAQGIYEALITTLGGLIVAITASFLAHYFEGKIQARFRQIEELMIHLLAQIEPYEGKVRFETAGRDLVTRDRVAADATASTSNPSTPKSTGLNVNLPNARTPVVPAPPSSRRSAPIERRDNLS